MMLRGVGLRKKCRDVWREEGSERGRGTAGASVPYRFLRQAARVSLLGFKRTIWRTLYHFSQYPVLMGYLELVVMSTGYQNQYLIGKDAIILVKIRKIP